MKIRCKKCQTILESNSRDDEVACKCRVGVRGNIVLWPSGQQDQWVEEVKEKAKRKKKGKLV